MMKVVSVSAGRPREVAWKGMAVRTGQESPGRRVTVKRLSNWYHRLMTFVQLKGKRRAMIAVRSWIVLTAVFTSCSLAAAADIPAGRPQIQGSNIRIEFDDRLRSRVVARFDNKETVMGPFSASETMTVADTALTRFLLTSQKQERTKDVFGDGTQLNLEGKAGTLMKKVTVTIYDDFPAMAFFDVQYTNTGKSKLAIKSWTNNAYIVNAQSGGNSLAFWSYQSGSYEKRPNWVLLSTQNFSRRIIKA